MILQFFKAVILVSLILLRISSDAQSNSIIDHFNVFEARGKVYAICVISAGNTCNGIELLRSTDSINYDHVAQIDGVCGSLSVSESHTIIDENPPKNKTIHYRLNIGGYGYTESKSIKIIDTREYGFQIVPNPANEKTTIYINNTIHGLAFNLKLYNDMGINIGFLSTSNNYFEINTLHLTSGIYNFVITIDGGEHVVAGKLLVRH